jgi:hypothetical protein
MPFPKGRSGNPRGRPKGIQTQIKLRQAIAAEVPAILDALVNAAKGGDTTAARLLLDRTLPALRPTDAPVSLPLGANLADTGGSILQAVASGRLTPAEGSTLLGGLAQLGRVIETSDLEQRIRALEERK